MMRHYYLAWAFPAIVVVWHQLQRNRRGGALAIVALVLWLFGAACLGWFIVRWYGAHLLALAALTVATAWSARRAQPVATSSESP